MIVVDSERRIFTLLTKKTAYQMRADGHGMLLHTYFGPRAEGADFSRLICRMDRGFSPNPADAGADRTYSPDTLPQEYSCAGAGDYRISAIEAELADGSAGLDLRFKGYEVRPGKYELPGLPGFWGDGAESLTVRLEDSWAGVAVELLYGVFEDRDLITRAVRVTNTGERAIALRRCASLCLDIQGMEADLVTLNGRQAMEMGVERGRVRCGVQSVGSVRGISSHQHNPFVMVCDTDATEDRGRVYGAMLLYSGNFEAAVEKSQAGDLRLVTGINPFHFRWRLEPGESFVSPEAATVFSDEGFGGMSRTLHRAIRENLVRDPYRGRRKPVLVNSWEAAYMDFDEEKLLSLARSARELGVELFVLDDGWFGHRDDDTTSLGDWYVNRRKLPEGLKGLGEKLRKLGLEFGVWVEPEMVSEESELYRAHPDWALGPVGAPPVRGRSQLVLDMTRKDVRDYILTALNDALRGADVKYVKWDMNRPLARVWSASLPPERQGEVYHRYVLGVYELLERFKSDHPGVLIEGCSGGGGRFDAGMLYYTPQIWCSDNTDAWDRVNIQYGESFGYPPAVAGAHVSAVPNAQTGRSTPLTTRGRVAMAGTFGYEMDLRRLSEGDRDVVRGQIEEYKRDWELVAGGEYYRLTPPSPDGAPAAWEFVSGDGKRAVMTAVAGQTHCVGPARYVKMRGLLPEAVYVDSDGQRWTGGELMSGGYPLGRMGEYESKMVRFEAESDGTEGGADA